MQIKCPKCGAIDGIELNDDRPYDIQDNIRKVNAICKCGNTFIVKYRGKPMVAATSES